MKGNKQLDSYGSVLNRAFEAVGANGMRDRKDHVGNAIRAMENLRLPWLDSNTDVAPSAMSQSLGNYNYNSEPIAPNVDLPRHALKTDFAPSAMSQSLDNVNMNKGAKRNVASDDWFSVGSTFNNKDFF